jgi:hypothetical protein
MAGTIAMSRTTRGGDPRPPVPGTGAFGRDAGGPLATPGHRERPSDLSVPEAGPDAFALGPALGAPVADAEIPVVFPGYVLPDDKREEPAHEGG